MCVYIYVCVCVFTRLCGDVASRYERHHKLAPNTISVCELRGSDGSVLDVIDAVSHVADDMEELVGIISTSSSADSGVHTHTHTHTHTHGVCLCVCACVYVNMCVCVCVCIYIV